MNNHIEIISTLKQHSFVKSFYEISDESHFWFQWRLNALLNQLSISHIPLDAAWKVLDVGGGSGVLRKQIESVTKWEVDFTDLDYKALCLSEPGRGRTMYYDIQEEKDEFKEKYDAVILFDVLEHIEKPHIFLSSLLKHLKPDGYLLVNVPALQSLYSVYDKIQGHVKRYGKADAIEELEAVGLTILDIRYWGFTLAPLALLRKIFLSLKTKHPSEKLYEQGFKPPNKFVNETLKKIMKAETKLIKKPPFGSSLLLLAKKTKEEFFA